jgi:hypothetical protein
MLNNFKLYRWLKGGIWYQYYPDLNCCTYMKFWTQNKNSIAKHEKIIKIEDYENNN